MFAPAARSSRLILSPMDEHDAEHGGGDGRAERDGGDDEGFAAGASVGWIRGRSGRSWLTGAMLPAAAVRARRIRRSRALLPSMCDASGIGLQPPRVPMVEITMSDAQLRQMISGPF